MTATEHEAAFRQLVQRFESGGKLIRAWPLEGGVSAQITALEIARSDVSMVKLVVRQHGARDRARNPHIARDEFRLMQITRQHGIASPKPWFVDESCELFPAPVVVIDFIEGETRFVTDDIAGFVSQSAAELAAIHTVTPGEVPFLFDYGCGFDERPKELDESLQEGRIRDALESAWLLPAMNAPVLLHGDYWPGNILWNENELAAVIDWEDAATGDPLADLGNVRLEFLWMFGPDAMRAFTNHYQSIANADLNNLPYWDLCAALRPCGKLAGWGLDPEDERRIRERHRLFVQEAVEALRENASRGFQPRDH